MYFAYGSIYVIKNFNGQYISTYKTLSPTKNNWKLSKLLIKLVKKNNIALNKATV